MSVIQRAGRFKELREFGALNWTILGVYVGVILSVGFVLSKRVTTDEDFYVGRRTTPWWAIGISVVATYVSVLSFLGGPAWSYSNSLAVIAIHLNYPLVIFAVVTVFLPFFFNSGVASIYDYIEKRFGSHSRLVISVVFLVSQALTSAAVLYATALVVQFVTGMDVKAAIVIVSIIALIYTSMGGTVAVIWADVFQSSILFIGTFVIFAALYHRLPMPIGAFLDHLKEMGKTHALDLSLDPKVEATVWTGLVAMSLYHITVYGANQMMVQRTLAVRNIGDAKKSYLLMGFGAFFIYFLFFLLGILLYGFYEGKHFANGNTIILEFAAAQNLPGLMGIIVAAVVAASMSSLGAAINSLATISNIDFYRKYVRKTASPQHYLSVSRYFTVFWAVVIIIPAIVYSASQGSVLQILTKIGAYFVGANLSMFGLGFYSKHTTEKGLLVGVAAGFAVIWYVAARTEVAWPWYCLIGGAVNMSVALVASYFIDGLQQQWSEYSVPGQKRKFIERNLPQSIDGWYLVPGKVDPICYWLLGLPRGYARVSGRVPTIRVRWQRLVTPRRHAMKEAMPEPALLTRDNDRRILRPAAGSATRAASRSAESRNSRTTGDALFRQLFPVCTDEARIAQGQGPAAFGAQLATHSAEFMGIPPTGKRVESRYIDFWKVQDGKIVDNWGMVDFPHAMGQLAVDPFDGHGGEAYDGAQGSAKTDSIGRHLSREWPSFPRRSFQRARAFQAAALGSQRDPSANGVPPPPSARLAAVSW